MPTNGFPPAAALAPPAADTDIVRPPTNQPKRKPDMNGKLDEISGKVKEVAGDALNDTKLKAEGLLQQGVGKAKEAAAELEGKAAEALEKGKAEAERLAGEAKEKAEGFLNDLKNKF